MNPSYAVGRGVFRLLFKGCFLWRIDHAARVPATGPVLLASNHASFLDPPLVGAALERPIHFMARDTLFRNPVLNRVFRSWNAVPVDRDGGGAGGLRIIHDLLARGQGVLLFPEGTRTRDGKLQPARSGIGLLALRTDVPVIPVRVFGTYEAFGRRHRLPRPHPVRVHFGEAIPLDAPRLEAKRCDRARLRTLYDEVSSDIMRAISTLH